MDIIKPINFWRRYKEEIIKSKPNLTKYHDATSWTALTRTAAVAAMKSATLEPIKEEPLTVSTEYFRVDVIGEETFAKEWDWSLRIAFEHENEYSRKQWKQELCKLTHVVADLRVLTAYYDSSEEEVESELQSQVNLLQRHSYRMTRVPDSEWLFIFGPAGRAKEGGGKFLIFRLEGVKVVRESDPDPLIPMSWGALPK